MTWKYETAISENLWIVEIRYFVERQLPYCNPWSNAQPKFIRAYAAVEIVIVEDL